MRAASVPAAASARPLRILHLLRTLDPESGGPLPYLEAAAFAHRDRPVTHCVANFEARGSAPRGTLHVYGAGGTDAWSVAKAALWLKRHVREFDLVHIHGVFSYPLFVGGMVCRRRGVPYVVSTHSHLYAWSLDQRRLAKRLYLAAAGRSLLSGASSLMTTSNAESRVLEHLLPRARTALAPPCLAVFPSAPSKQPPDAPLKVTFLGRLAPQKGVPTLLSALARLRGQQVAAVLDIVGSGDADYVDGLRAQCRRLGIEPYVSFRGFLSGAEKDATLAEGHVFALPSHVENFSFATAEALALGLPAVVSSEVALAEVVERHGCGAVVPPDDVAALATALGRFADPAARAEAARRARACAGVEFGPQRMAAALEAAYRQAVSEAPRPGTP